MRKATILQKIATWMARNDIDRMPGSESIQVRRKSDEPAQRLRLSLAAPYSDATQHAFRSFGADCIA